MYDEVVKSLRLCSSDNRGYGCAKERAYGKNHPLNWLCMDYLLKEAADAIEELSKLALDEHNRAAVAAWERRWIPVSERLPKAGERVLCYCRANIFEVMKMRTNGDWVYDVHHIYMHSFVTHWMPLPQPPKEE